MGSRLKLELNEYIILDKALAQDQGFVDITCPNTLRATINETDSVILLAAEHRDDVSPLSKYYDTNVQGTQNVLDEMDRVGCKHLIFTSSVAVYGLNKVNPDEKYPVDPFNHYGKIFKTHASFMIRSSAINIKCYMFFNDTCAFCNCSNRNFKAYSMV